MFWLAGPFFLNAAVVAPDNFSGVLLTNGRVEVVFSEIGEVELMAETFRSGRQRLAIDGGSYEYSSRPLLQPNGKPRTAAVVWFPRSGAWSLLPGVTNWSNIRTTIRVPYWCVAVPFAALALASERRRRVWLAQDRLGKCAKCGYDRAGLAASAVCPECGGVPLRLTARSAAN